MPTSTQTTTTTTKTTTQNKPAPIDLNMKLVLPGFSGTIAQLIQQTKEQKQVKAGTGKRQVAIKSFLTHFWTEKAGRGFSQDIVGIGKTVAKEVGIKFTPYTVINRGLVFRLKEKGMKAFYVISQEGVKEAGIDPTATTTPVQVAPSAPTASQSVAAALEKV